MKSDSKQKPMFGKDSTMKKILFIGSEAMPFAATGGLGDVLGSLPASLASAKECDVRVILPLYAAVGAEWRAQMKEEAVFYVPLAWRRQYCGVYSLQKDGVTYYFVDNEYYFKRPELYGFFDDGERYAYFCMAALDLLEKVRFCPDVLHAHDWQAALSIVYLDRLYRQKEFYRKIRTVFTIHNIEYQGKYDFAILGDVFGLGEDAHALMEYGDCINLMKAAIECADCVTTVSPRYAEEIRMPEYSHGLHYILQQKSEKLCGILNGIDYTYYDPKRDPSVPHPFTARSVPKKVLNKIALQRELGLPEREEVPMLAVISRLAAHKGLDLITECIEKLIREQDLQLVLLGKGEPRFEQFFSALQERYPDRVRALITYDRALSKRIYAAADLFFMPSKSEPCGLSQMIASRYGAIPIVRETGGLFDSIHPYYREGETLHGNGFTFSGYSAGELKERTEAALALWRDPSLRQRFISKIMQIDFSWGASAKRYLELYQRL